MKFKYHLNVLKPEHKVVIDVSFPVASLKKLVVKRPVQPVSAIPANPPKQEEAKRKQSNTPKSPTTPKSPVILHRERKKSVPPEPTGRRPVSIVLEPDSLQVTGGVQQSLSEPTMQLVGIDYPFLIYKRRGKGERSQNAPILQCAQWRPFHNTGNSVPYSLKTVCGFFN